MTINTHTFLPLHQSVIMESIVAKSKSIPAFLPKRDLHTLLLHTPYHILAMRHVETRFGRSVVVDLEGPPYACIENSQMMQDEKFHVFLPKRWCTAFTDDQLLAVKPCTLALTITSHVQLSNNKYTSQLDIQYVSILLFALSIISNIPHDSKKCVSNN